MNDANFVNSILSEFAVDADDPLIRVSKFKHQFGKSNFNCLNLQETLNQIKREQEKDADKKE
jgi:hypothetical protein